MSVSPLCERLKQYKVTTPPWKETFRKECMNRLRENRRRLIDQNRQDVTSAVVQEGWSKLSEQYDDIDAYLVIYDEIRKELDDEADRLFQEYELGFNCRSIGESSQIMNTDHLELRFSCAVCGRKNEYPAVSSTIDGDNIVSFCECGQLQVDRRTKVLEPFLGFGEINKRFRDVASGHASGCNATPILTTVDGGMNDGTQLITFCQDCGMQLVLW